MGRKSAAQRGSSLPSRRPRYALQAAPIPCPPVLVTSEEVTIGKPHPERHEFAARQLGVNVKKRLLFQHAAAGILTARTVHARAMRAHGAAGATSRADNTVVFDVGRRAVITTSGSSLDAVAELSTAARLPESDCGSGCVQPLSRTATVPMKMDATPSRSFTRRINHYLLVTMYTVRVHPRREVLQRYDCSHDVNVSASDHPDQRI